jgi:hypothetical protein
MEINAMALRDKPCLYAFFLPIWQALTYQLDTHPSYGVGLYVVPCPCARCASLRSLRKALTDWYYAQQSARHKGDVLDAPDGR